MDNKNLHDETVSVTDSEKHQCRICQFITSPLGMPAHLKYKHQLSVKEYYDTYIKQDNEGKCLICGKETIFSGLTKKYNPYCSRECANTSPIRIQHIANTNIERYGTSCALASKQIREKVKKTNLEKYGAENIFGSDYGKAKIKQTNLERYGETIPSKCESVKEKAKKTCKERYGVEYSFQSKNNKQKSKQTMLRKYGVEHNFQRPDVIEHNKKASHTLNVDQKRNKTLAKNHVLEIYLHKQLNIEFEIEYYSELYPFCCDLYIPKYNLYIEINNFWTHMNHFFDENNREDIERLNILQEKAKNNQFYRNAIRCWTNKDINKRDIAIKNNLNYVVLWNKEHIDLFIQLLNEGKEFIGFNDFNEQ